MKQVKREKLIHIHCLIIVFILLSFSVGCSTGPTPKDKGIMASYMVTGQVLEGLKPTLKTLCNDGVLNNKDCTEARNIYNNAVKMYYMMGNTAIGVIGTNSDDYWELSKQLTELLVILGKYTEN